MKIRRSILAIALIGSTLGVFAQPASAGQPIAGCTDGFELKKVKSFEQVEAAQATDRNGDGWLCAKALPGVGNEGAFNAIDNTKK
jgi:hypothetical protein